MRSMKPSPKTPPRIFRMAFCESPMPCRYFAICVILASGPAATFSCSSCFRSESGVTSPASAANRRRTLVALAWRSWASPYPSPFHVPSAQQLIGPIAATLQLHAGLAGLIMTLTQLGYGTGLLLLVPLADVVENRRLITFAMAGAVIGLVGITLSGSAATFLAASFLVGTCAVAAQVLVPLASHLVPEATRGKVVGNIMAGLLAGIMLARPFSSMVAAAFGWRAVFGISAVLMATLAVVMWRALPQRRPHASVGYARTMASLPGIVWRTPLLRRRAVYQGMMFAGFQAFWTTVPLALAREFNMGQGGIALFALAGAAGALAAPWAGR